MAFAQSNTSGALFGQAQEGATIQIQNPATGFSRTITVGRDGNYRFSALPTGTYNVTVENADGTRTTREGVNINVGTGTPLNFATASSAGVSTLDAIEVRGSAINPIDVSSVESSTILTAEQIARVPVARDITSVALLAPGTVKGDAAFGNLASFGGSSVAENQYYVNGLNVTNTFKNLSYTQVPFEAVAEQQTKTGGYGAEFGRSTGGVINIITKRGTNEFHAGGNIFWEPVGLAETNPDLYYPDGSLHEVNSKDKGWSATAAAWASGALVKDKLFFYAVLQQGQTSADDYAGTSDGITPDDTNFHRESTRPHWLVKLDWNINENNLLELTSISDKRRTDTRYYDTTFGTASSPSWDPKRSDYIGKDIVKNGGESYSLKYTGYFGNDFTLSALAGRNEFSRSNYQVTASGIEQVYDGNVNGAVSGCPVITDARPDAISGAVPMINGCSIANTLVRSDANDSRDQYRIDAEWQLGSHLIRGGIDIDNFTTVDGTAYSGGAAWRYGRYQGRDDIVRKRVFKTGATVDVDQTAYYLEDTWSVTDRFRAYAGLRWDTFENKNGDGQTYVKIKNQFAPRLGFSWDVGGDSTMKIYGNAGRYALPLTANVAIRGASASLYSEEYFTYTGVDPATGAPTGLTRIINPANGQMIRYLNNEFGVGKDPKTIASEGLDPQYQDEFILGFQMALSDSFSGGISATYRKMKSTIDDNCDYRPIFEWADQNGYDIQDVNPGFPYCRLYNPGKDSVFNMDVDGDGTLETIPVAGSVLGPEGRRSYKAIDVFVEGQLFDKLFLRGSYTWSKNEGNAEGGVKSDIGQADTGTTQDFDYAELMIGAYGWTAQSFIDTHRPLCA